MVYPLRRDKATETEQATPVPPLPPPTHPPVGGQVEAFEWRKQGV